MEFPDATRTWTKRTTSTTTVDVVEKKEYLFMQIHINYFHVCTSSYVINFAFVTCKQCNLIHQLRRWTSSGAFSLISSSCADTGGNKANKTMLLIVAFSVLFTLLPSISITSVINFRSKQTTLSNTLCDTVTGKFFAILMYFSFVFWQLRKNRILTHEKNVQQSQFINIYFFKSREKNAQRQINFL